MKTETLNETVKKRRKALKMTQQDLAFKAGEEVTHSTPHEIMAEIAALDAESAKVLAKIQELL